MNSYSIALVVLFGIFIPSFSDLVVKGKCPPINHAVPLKNNYLDDSWYVQETTCPPKKHESIRCMKAIGDVIEPMSTNQIDLTIETTREGKKMESVEFSFLARYGELKPRSKKSSNAMNSRLEILKFQPNSYIVFYSCEKKSFFRIKPTIKQCAWILTKNNTPTADSMAKLRHGVPRNSEFVTIRQNEC